MTTGSIERRAFLKRGATAAVALLGAPLLSARAAAAGDRLVVAIGQWGTETPFAWRHVQAEKPLWDCVYDPLIMREPKTFEYRPGLATEWKPSNEMRTWTFKLRSGVKFHEGLGELTAEDVKFTVEQSFKPDSLGGSAYFFRNHLDRIETPDKLTVVMHFKSRQWIVPSLFTQYVGYQNPISKKYFESVGEQKAAAHPIGTGPYRHVEGKQGDYHRFEAVPGHWRKTPAFKELVIRRIAEPATRLSGLRAGEIDIAQVFGDYLGQAQKAGLRELPVMVREVTDKEAFEIALIENIQREDLNPVEEAEAYKRLIEEHGLTQEELAARVGKERSTVANALRLLRLPEAIKDAIVDGQLSMGHARALLAISDEGDLRKAATRVIAENLSVRAVEALVQRLKSKRLPREKRDGQGGAQVRHLVERLQRKLGAKVELKDKGGSGTLEIRYGNLQELDRVLAAILGD